MTYHEVVDWIFQRLPMYQQIGGKAYKVDLTNIEKLASHLGNPQNDFPTVHVAGTNGKGSVSHMLASILQESGNKVGLYTSPHLKDFRERIKINGKEIEEKAVKDFVLNNKKFLEGEDLSFFEVTVGMAFEYFAEEKVDIAVIEVGLGGRLDSTNIIHPEVSIITNIGLDHTAILGNTLEAIAAEKAGIIKKDIPVVIGEKQEETYPVFAKIAEEKSAPLFMAEDVEDAIEICLGSDLKGFYQKKNIKTVQMAVKVLRERGWNISEEDFSKGLSQVILNTGLRGRWDVIKNDPKVICDTAHNREGLVYAMNQLLQEPYENLFLVLGVVNDKDLKSVLPLFPQNAHYFFCRPNIPRGLDAKILQEEAAKNGLFGGIYNSVSEAYEAALSAASAKDVIYIGGSTFTVAEII